MYSATSVTAEVCWWAGESGQNHVFSRYPLTNPAFSGPAVYIMARFAPAVGWYPLYIGETLDIGRRITDHWERNLPLALAEGGNELHLHFLAETKSELLRIETDLRHRWKPPLNRQPIPEVVGLGFGSVLGGAAQGLKGTTLGRR